MNGVRLDIPNLAPRFTSSFRAITSAMLQAFFPKICANCSNVCEEGSPICETCHQNISFIERPRCVLCAAPLDCTMSVKCQSCMDKPTSITEMAAVFEYNAHSQSMILRLKYQDNTTNVIDYARWMHKKGQSLLKKADIIVPVPLHRAKLLSRRYNQSALLAQKISAMSSKPLDVFALKKIRNTKPQNGMTAAQRAKNIHGSFSVTEPNRLQEKVVVLVDDVVTTGATLQECARTMLAAGAREVLALTLGRTLSWLHQQV